MSNSTNLPLDLLKSIQWHQEQLHNAFVQALNMVYLVDKEDAAGDGRFVVPCRHVYDELAKQFNVPVWKMNFQRYCKQIVIDCGAIHQRYGTVSFFRGIRRRDECESKSVEMSRQYRQDALYGKRYDKDRVLGTHTTHTASKKKQKESLVEEWEKRLEAEGLPSELKIALGVEGPWKVDNLKKEIAEGRIEKAVSSYWRVYRDFCILGLFIQGKAIFPIAEQLKIGRKVVWNRLKFYGLTSVEE